MLLVLREYVVFDEDEFPLAWSERLIHNQIAERERLKEWFTDEAIDRLQKAKENLVIVRVD